MGKDIWVPCPNCDTTGDCYNCGGRGKNCQTCNGSGDCPSCGGSGQLNERSVTQISSRQLAGVVRNRVGET